jgi:hypothetical protein
MLIPDPRRSLQRRRMTFTEPFRVWGQAVLLNLLLIVALLLAGYLVSTYPAWPQAVSGGALGLALVWGLTLLLAFPLATDMQLIQGKNPQVNREVIRSWGQEQAWTLQEERPDFMIIEPPTPWYQGRRQVTFLFQGRDVWIHAAGYHRYLDCITLLNIFVVQRLKREVGEVVAARLSRQEWEEE